MSQIARTIAAVERVDDVVALKGLVSKELANRGYDRVLIYSASGVRDVVVDALLWLEGDWFGNGQDVTPELYLARCPVNRHVFEIDTPFFWTKRQQDGKETYSVVEHPSGPGIHGLQIPVFSQSGLVGAASFGGMDIDSSLEARLDLTLLGNAAFRSLSRLTRVGGVAGRVAALTAREREVLRWVASGRRQGEIAAQLRLSERTIENHLRRIRQRLGATSTAQAVQILISSERPRGEEGPAND